MKANIEFGNIEEGKANVIILNRKQGRILNRENYRLQSTITTRILNKLKKYFTLNPDSDFDDKLYYSKPEFDSFNHTSLIVNESKRRRIRLIVNDETHGIKRKTSRTAYQIRNSIKGFNEVFIYDNPRKGTKVTLGLFIRSNIDDIEKILISGYVSSNKDNEIKHNYHIEIKNEVFHLLEHPVLWFDFDIPIPDEILCDEKASEIKVVINSISGQRFDKKYCNYIYISSSNGINSNNLNKKSVLVISLDGISYNDFFCDRSIFLNSRTVNDCFDDFIKFKYPKSSSTVSISSAASLLTGLGLSRHLIYDLETGRNDPQLGVLSDGIIALPELLESNGYSCYGITAFSGLSPFYGFSRGFQQYENISSHFAHTNFGYLQRLIKILNYSKGHPSFVFAHFPGGHPPLVNHYIIDGQNSYETAYNYTINNSINLVYSIIGYMKEIGTYDDHMIIITSDHGKSVLGFKRVGYQFLDSRISVPFLIKLPDKKVLQKKWADKKGNLFSVNSSIYPLVIDVLGIDAPDYMPIYSKRIFNDVIWVTETIDYNSYNRLGIVGYDQEYKWILYYLFDNRQNLTSTIDEIRAYRLDENMIANDEKNIISMIDSTRVKNVLSQANEYLHYGNEFSKKNPLACQGGHSYLI